MQHLVTRMQNPELFLHESVALEMVLQVTPSPEEPFQEPLTQGLTLYIARIMRICDKWQLLHLRLSCIHMTMHVPDYLTKTALLIDHEA